ncbi:M24 family metallopeptidase [Methanothrix soehngenii]|jgi:Xaa-Pro aminopeptidase|nr:Xaa-Pro peptidase family protein [Methanothrix soehngenii]MCK9586332.1 Xaa-Pro peptidase family protein [Methanothrix soehngenii]MDD3552632.1 Xaa-Pro peptidase family protein [Methanothrix soehngenii]MDD5257686.1 Xaa-Pro peptidase family protein [Methanothrix soehngenii]
MDYVLHPRSEIDSRIKKLQSSMDGIDGALLFQAVDMCYFSGTAQDGLVYIPRDGEPIIMMKRSLVRAKEESPLEVRPLKNMRNLKEDLGIKTSATIGLEMDVLPCSFYFRVNKALEDASFVDVAERIKHIRSVKSEFEIKLAKEAAQMLVEGFSTVPDHIKEGMTEVELMCRMESEMRLMGHQGSLRFRRFNSIVPIGHIMSGSSAAIPSFLASPTGGRGTSVVFPHGPGYRKIKRNEPVFVDTVGICNGYIADATRIFSLGKIEPGLVEAYEASCQIEEAIAREMMPGRTARELFELSESEGARLGYGDFLGGPVGSKCGFVGHGVGLELDEYPVLAPLDHEIQEGMTIAVEPKIIYPGKGVLGVEDTFLTTSSGALRLTEMPLEIWEV